MRVFETEGKFNFVDETDVLVGFDAWASCCENFGYFFSTSVPKTISVHEDPIAEGWVKPTPAELSRLVFDRDFFHDGSVNGSCYDDNFVTFKLVPAKPFGEHEEEAVQELYLTLYNSHNGYYSHGFEVKVGGTVLKEGSL